MLDYQNTVEQMANPQQNSLGQSYQQQHHSMAQNTESSYFYPDTSASRQPFSFNAAPLSALHGMTDIKVPQAAGSPPAFSNYNSAAYYSMKNSMLNATPHGISDILSRPDLQAQLQARLGQGMYYNSCSQGGAGTAGLSPTSKDMSASRSLYHWPNNSPVLQTNQSQGWHSKHGMISIDGKDSKKKNTRPTFSGSQIFALEKTFEQQKYLAGPERGRLAYALGMSESQVKVWFQNRRTKWRKRHAAEMASTKRRPDNQNTQGFEQSDSNTGEAHNNQSDTSNNQLANASDLHI